MHAVVPLNTRAEVYLPGGDRAEVGAGRHEWTVPDPRTRPAPAPVTLGSTLGEIADDAEAYALVQSTVEELAGRRTSALRSLREWTDQRTLEDELARLAPAARERVAAALDPLSSRRGSRP